MVEKIVLSSISSNAVISSENYNNYLTKATSGAYLDSFNQEFGARNTEATAMASATSGNSGLAITNQPLCYTFYTINHFEAQQEVQIQTTSDLSHYVDVMYYQTDEPAIFPADSLIVAPLSTVQPTSIIINPGIMRPAKLLYAFIYADSEERQGLNWKGVAELALNTNKYITSMQFTAEKAGRYLIRVRAHDNYHLGTADVTINGAYYYEDVPISASYAELAMPADDQEYTTYTICDNPNTDDPMLFIHGADADRVVGFNDDAASSSLLSEMCEFDAFIAQTYIIPTTRVSVNSYSSSNPESTCTIYGRVPTETTAKKQSRKKTFNSEQASLNEVISSSLEIPTQIRIDSSFKIKSSIEIKKISAYQLDGTLIGEVACHKCVDFISTSVLNIYKKGVYVLCIETASGVIAKKVIAL